MRYKDKVVIVTGGSSGIGKGCVSVFVDNGANVVFCSHEETDGREVETECNSRGEGSAWFIKCDVTQESELSDLVNKTVERFGRIDCLINNVGQHPTEKTIDEFTADEFRKILEINVISYFQMSKLCLPFLRKSEGCIINTSSLVAQMGQPSAVTYVATKAAIDGMTRALAIDEAAHNVRVNAISPGNIWTRMWERQVNDSPDPYLEEQSGRDAQLNGRFGTIEECGLTCLFLATDATFCTGININLTAGAELSYGKKNRRPETTSVLDAQ